MQIHTMTALALGQEIAAGRLSAREATQAYLERITDREPGLHAYLSVDAERALDQADAVDKSLAAGERLSPLAGVPMAVKDNICTRGLRTSCASKMLENFVPGYNATAVERLEAAGAVVLGKTNMDEFAMGSTTETSAFGPSFNPWNTQHVPGGSSGGSCVATAAGECAYALGSDTGGSIRQPAAYCGVYGIKPSYGRVSRYGLVAYASSLDQIGPIARSAEDCAAVLELLCGHDHRDATSLPDAETGFVESLSKGVKGMKIGVPNDYFGEGLEPEIREAIEAQLAVLREAGAQVERFELGLLSYAIPCYYTLATAEASSNLERFDGVKYGLRAEGYDGLHDMYKKSRTQGFGPEVRRRIMLGSFVLSSGYYDAYYLKALKVRALLKQAMDRAFARYDLLVAPAAPTLAPKLGSTLSDPMQMYLSDIYTISANLTGIPGMGLPCRLSASGLPIGMQLFADRLQEAKIFRAAGVLSAADVGSFKSAQALSLKGGSHAEAI